MKTLLLSTLILISSHSFSQIWGRPGATWHYTKSVFGNGYVTVKYTQDTLIDGQHCQQYKATLYDFNQINAEGDMQMFVTSMGKWNTYVNGNIVYYRVNDIFEVLYDFDAEVGNIWYSNTSQANSMCNDTSTIEVIGMGTTIIDGQSMLYQTIIDIESSSFGFSSGGETKIVPRLGNIGSGFLFPILGRNCDPNMIVDFYQFHFRCYEDDEIYYNPYDLHCEYFLNIQENETLKLTIAPNPVNSLLNVNLAEGNHDFEILTITGQQVQSGKMVLSQNQLDVSELKNGVYYLKVIDDQDNVGVIRFVKN